MFNLFDVRSIHEAFRSTLASFLRRLRSTSRNSSCALLCLSIAAPFTSTHALGQGGQFPPPSITWANFNLTVTSQQTPRYQLSPYPAYGSGTILVFYQNVTGSPAGCGWSVTFGTQNQIGFIGITNFTYSVTSFTNGVAAYRVGDVTTFFNAYSTIGMYWTCGTYPTTGNAQVEFIPDLTFGPPIYTYSHISTNTTTQLGNTGLNTARNLHGISVNNPGSAEVITITDTNTAGCTGGTVIAVFSALTASQAGQFLTFDVTTNAGLCITTAGTTPGDFTVSYR